jgi:hypothetical protein
MSLTSQKRALLAAGDIKALIGLNHGIYGNMQMMARGYNSSADVLKTTIDGQDLNALWAEFQATLDVQNEKQSALASLFSFNTTLASELVAQSFGGDDFEEASEYGKPKGLRAAPEMVKLGYPHKWYDTATRFTWKALSTMSAAQVQSIHAAVLAADNRLVFKKIMQRVFNPATTVNEDGTSVFGFWNGTEGTPPMSPDGDTFSSTHNHYMISGAASMVSGDVDDLVDTIEHHGYGLRQNGDRVIVFANPAEADEIVGFRVATGAKFDAIPTTDAPAFITAETIQGQRPPGKFNGLEVACGYGDAWVVSDRQIPAGYLVGLATGGPDSTRNPMGFREAPQPELQGLIQLPGNDAMSQNYPLIDSTYTRGFGVGTRLRGAGAVMQIKASGSYAVPSLYA